MNKSNEIKITTSGNNIAINSPYNADFADKMHLLGGEWTGNTWEIEKELENNVIESLYECYGWEPETDYVRLEITFNEEEKAGRKSYSLFGRSVARAYGRDSGAKPADGIVFTEKQPVSGGSMKNWATIIPKGSVILIKDFPRSALKRFNITDDNLFIRVIESSTNNDDVTIEDLLDRRIKLEAELKNINEILAFSGN